MEEEIEKVRTAISDYLLSIDWQEMDQDDRIEQFWADIGNDIFDEEHIEGYHTEKRSEIDQKDFERYERENPDK